MHSPRSARFLARLILVWFVLSLGAAIASPFVGAGSGELICSASGGMKWVGQGDDSQPALKLHAMDCPLCASASAPPPVDVLAGKFGTRLPEALPVFASAEIPSGWALNALARAPPWFA